MSTLTIKDLHVTAELDSKKMSAVRGGFSYMPYPSYNFVNVMPISINDSKNVFGKQSNATEIGSQIATGNDSAFLDNVFTKSNPYVDNSNSIKV